MTKTVTPLHDNVIVKVINVEDKTAGGIVLVSAVKEKPVHGIVLSVGEYSYHRNGNAKPFSVATGDTICFMKDSGTTIMEAPEGETWLCIPEDCIHYKVNTHE